MQKYEDIGDDPQYTDQEDNRNYEPEYERMVTNYAIGEE